MRTCKSTGITKHPPSMICVEREFHLKREFFNLLVVQTIVSVSFSLLSSFVVKFIFAIYTDNRSRFSFHIQPLDLFLFQTSQTQRRLYVLNFY